jgi:hypothetical protein
MKSILLASASVLAFAGAAAAEVEFGGEAEFSYNSNNGVGTFDSSAELTIDASQELDNGFTAAASASVDLIAGTFEMDTASITSDTAGITYYFQEDGQGAAYIGDELDQMSVVENMFEDEDDIDEDVQVEVFGTIAGTTVTVTMNNAEELELGVATEVAGAAVAFAYDDAASTFGVSASDLSAGPVTLDIALANDGTDTFYGLNAETTAGGVDLSFDIGDAGWTIGADYAISDAFSVGAEYSDDESWTVTADYSDAGVSFGIEYNSDESWEVTAGYDMEPITVDAEFNSDDEWTIDGSYDLGNGLDIIAGAGSDDQVYVAATYDLGSGAEILVSYAEIAGTDDDADEDLLAGTTVKVSFEF